MIKSIALAHRKTGMTRKEFSRYWKEEHGPLAAKMIPGIRRYVQNHFVEVPGMDFRGDGIVEMWYDDVDAWQNSMKFIHSEDGTAIREDGMKFAEMRDNGGLWIVEEYVIMDETSR